MFDEIYRQANDDIPVNNCLLADLKRKARQIDTKTADNAEKKPVLNVYRYGFAAASLIVVLLGASIFSSYQEAKNDVVYKTENHMEKSAENTETSDIGETTGTDAVVTDTKIHNDNDLNGETNQSTADAGAAKLQTVDDAGENDAGESHNFFETQTKENQTDETEFSLNTENGAGNSYGDHTPETYSISEETDEAAEGDFDTAENETDNALETRVSSGQSAGGGGGGSASASAESAVLKSAPIYDSLASVSEAQDDISVHEEWSIESYCAHFGFNISQIILPRGMKESRSGSAHVYTDSGGNIIDSQCTVFYADSGKSVMLSLHTDVDYIKSVFADGEKISSCASVKRYDNGAFTVYAYSGRCGYIAEVSGFSEQELNAFANSLK